LIGRGTWTMLIEMALAFLAALASRGAVEAPATIDARIGIETEFRPLDHG